MQSVTFFVAKRHFCRFRTALKYLFLPIIRCCNNCRFNISTTGFKLGSFCDLTKCINHISWPLCLINNAEIIVTIITMWKTKNGIRKQKNKIGKQKKELENKKQNWKTKTELENKKQNWKTENRIGKQKSIGETFSRTQCLWFLLAGYWESFQNLVIHFSHLKKIILVSICNL